MSKSNVITDIQIVKLTDSGRESRARCMVADDVPECRNMKLLPEILHDEQKQEINKWIL
jgi:hypothetical protein